MPTRSRIGVLALLLAVTVLGAGCDSNGTIRGSEPSVQFASESFGVVPADSIANVEVTLTGSTDGSVSVEVLYAAPVSSTSFSDLGGIDSTNIVQSVEFPGSLEGDTTATRAVEIDVSDADISEGPKEAFFALQNLETSGDVVIGTPRETTLNVGFPPLAEIREQGVGTSSIFEAIVVEVAGDDARVQDATAGIAITRRDDFTGDVQRGDEVRITGTVSTFANQLQIDTDDLSTYEVLSSGNALPEPVDVTLEEINNNVNEYESERVRVEGLTIDPGGDDAFQAGGSEGNYTVTDEAGTELTLRIPGASYWGGQSIPEGTITFEGVLGEFFSGPQLRARYEGDIIVE